MAGTAFVTDKTVNSNMDKLQDKLVEVVRHYLLPMDLNPGASEVKRAAKEAPEWIANPAKVFLENIEAAVTTTQIPYTFAITRVLTMRLRQLTTSHRIRVQFEALTTFEDIDRKKTPEEQAGWDVVAHERALKEFQEEQKDPDTQSQVNKEWSNILIDGLQDRQMETASKELLRQAVVMIWGAFEVLCRDVFVGLLNNNPTEVQKLTADSDTKKIFQAKGIGLEELSEYDFDVSKNLGNVFVNAYDFSSLGAIKQTFKVLFFSNKELQDQLNDHRLWILHQRRHLIVHRRAVVDKQYLNKTGEKMKIGEQLTPAPVEIREYIKLVCESVLALVKATAKK
jgi:hypothetical protein